MLAREKLQSEVLHLDEVMDKMGRKDKAAIGAYIAAEAAKAAWIMDGNAFTKDKHARITTADLIVVFDINRFKALVSHLTRYVKLKTGLQKNRAGGEYTKLNLAYYVPYILWQFPARKRAAVERAKKASKPIKTIKSHKQADQLLHELARSSYKLI